MRAEGVLRSPLTDSETSSDQGIHAKMSPTTTTFGRDKSLRLCEKSLGFFHTAEGSCRTCEGSFPRPKNRTKYNYANAVDEIMSRIVQHHDRWRGDRNTPPTPTSARTRSPARLTRSRRSASTTRPAISPPWTAFGRVQDQAWKHSGQTGPLDEYTYGYDAAGNRTSRTNAVDAVLSESYQYDS